MKLETLFNLLLNMMKRCNTNIQTAFYNTKNFSPLASGNYIIVDFLNSIFSLFTPAGILFDTKSLINSPMVDVK